MSSLYIEINFFHEKYDEYKRELNLDTAVASVEYQVDGIQFERKVFEKRLRSEIRKI